MSRDGEIVVNGQLTVPPLDQTWRFGPSGGPGGQHANTANTRAELVFEIATASCLTDGQRQRLTEVFGPRVRVVADGARSQTRNRDEAAARLATRLADALKPQRTRRATKPSRRAKERRLQAKRHQSQRKSERQRPNDY